MNIHSRLELNLPTLNIHSRLELNLPTPRLEIPTPTEQLETPVVETPFAQVVLEQKTDEPLSANTAVASEPLKFPQPEPIKNCLDLSNSVNMANSDFHAMYLSFLQQQIDFLRTQMSSSQSTNNSITSNVPSLSRIVTPQPASLALSHVNEPSVSECHIGTDMTLNNLDQFIPQLKEHELPQEEPLMSDVGTNMTIQNLNHLVGDICFTDSGTRISRDAATDMTFARLDLALESQTFEAGAKTTIRDITMFRNISESQGIPKSSSVVPQPIAVLNDSILQSQPKPAETQSQASLTTTELSSSRLPTLIQDIANQSEIDNPDNYAPVYSVCGIVDQTMETTFTTPMNSTNTRIQRDAKDMIAQVVHDSEQSFFVVDGYNVELKQSISKATKPNRDFDPNMPTDALAKKIQEVTKEIEHCKSRLIEHSMSFDNQNEPQDEPLSISEILPSSPDLGLSPREEGFFQNSMFPPSNSILMQKFRDENLSLVDFPSEQSTMTGEDLSLASLEYLRRHGLFQLKTTRMVCFTVDIPILSDIWFIG